MDTHFKLPPRQLKQLSFCSTNRDALAHWAEQLPIADMGKTTRFLYLALDELCQLDVSPQLRAELIKSLQPSLRLTREGLGKSFYNQPIIMPDQPRKIANLCQALQQRTATVYLIIASDCQAKMGSLFKKPTLLLNQALFSAMDNLLDILIRDYALYRPIADGLWQNMHKLYQIAQQHKLCTTTANLLDSQNTLNIQQLYQCCMLWGCIKANQLRQKDILSLKPFVREWAALVHLEKAGSDDNGLIINPNSDQPPMYKKFYPGKLDPKGYAINTHDLIQELKQFSGPLAPAHAKLSENLINHLILTWGVLTDRTFMRLDANSSLSLCIGLSTTHFYLSGEKSFAELIYGTDSDIEQNSRLSEFTAKRSQAQIHEKKQSRDVWNIHLNGEDGDISIDNDIPQTQVALESIDYHIRSGGNSVMTSTGSNKEKYRDYHVDVVNMSPGGYCLEWSDNVPHSIKAGEIIGIKDTHHRGWNIGAIRWVKQGNTHTCASLQIGVELLSPSGQACGAHIIDENRQPLSDFMRVLKLPEIKAAAQPCTLVTPALSFRSGQSIVLAQDGQEEIIQLQKLLSSSGSYFLFTYEVQETLAKTPASVTIRHSLDDSPDGEFDSVWETL